MSLTGELDVPPGVALVAATLITALAFAIALFSLPVGFYVRAATAGAAAFAQFLVSYASLYRPYSQLRSDHRTQLVRILFDGLVREYAEVADADSHVRANVMPITQGFGEGIVPRRREYLKIEFHTDGYDREELEQRYAPGEGCCGQAYARNNPTYYDERRRPVGEGRMSATQRRVTEEVKSVLSVPVYHPGKVDDEIIAVINLDSTAHIEETNFNERDVHSLVMKYAGRVGHVLA